jgi:hypothetical protein
MHLTSREFWTVFHGMLIGAIYLLAYAGGFAGLWSLKEELLTAEGMRERMKRMHLGLWTMAIASWVTVISGTYIVYPWYRAKTPDSPRSILLADPNTAAWHTFGMEWKEHVAWLAPIIATAVAVIVAYYGKEIAKRPELRRALLILFTLSFFAGAAAGAFGAFINKIAPIH